jgi:hypothetical protein
MLTSAVVTEFRAQGVDATAGEPTAGAYTLEGVIRNFSTEARWGREAHISGIIRLIAPDRRQLVEKNIAVRESGYNLNNFDTDLLEDLLNGAFVKFVRDVASDPDIKAALKP